MMHVSGGCGTLRSGGKVGEPQAAELPACRGRKKVAITEPVMPGRGRERGAAQHHLVHHEFPVVLAERTGRRPVPGIGRIGAARPLPDDAESVLEFPGPRRDLPLRLAWQVLAGPAGKGIGLVIADMADRQGFLDGPQPAERETVPGAVDLAPMAGRGPALGADRGPAV